MREEATWQASYDYWRMADIVDSSVDGRRSMNTNPDFGEAKGK